MRTGSTSPCSHDQPRALGACRCSRRLRPVLPEFSSREGYGPASWGTGADMRERFTTTRSVPDARSIAYPMTELDGVLTPETVVAPEIVYGTSGLLLDYMTQSDEYVRVAFDRLDSVGLARGEYPPYPSPDTADVWFPFLSFGRRTGLRRGTDTIAPLRLELPVRRKRR